MHNYIRRSEVCSLYGSVCTWGITGFEEEVSIDGGSVDLGYG